MKKIFVRKGDDGMPVFYCTVCGQSFDDQNERNEHEAICRELGPTNTPRPQDLSEWKE